MKKLAYLFSFTLLFSCGEINHRKDSNLMQDNELVITAEGDSLEHGFWVYNLKNTALTKKGKYIDGFKTGNWTYNIANEEKIIEWIAFDKNGVKFNYPKYLKVISNNIESQAIFLGDIVDNNDYTYIALLEYDLKSMNSSIYDYLYQLNETFDNDTTKIIISKNLRKYTFKNIDVFTINIQEKKHDDIMYSIISHVFEVKGYLYDFTYKDCTIKTNPVSYEVFKDMLYSMECHGMDLFTYNTGQYLKDENVIFE